MLLVLLVLRLAGSLVLRCCLWAPLLAAEEGSAAADGITFA